MECADCVREFQDGADASDLVARIHARFPIGFCEECKIGDGSPGPVQPHEDLYRFFVDPTDVDLETSDIARRSFKWCHTNGLSVFRQSASDADIEALVVDVLAAKPGKSPKTVRALLCASCDNIRQIRETRIHDAPRQFCVYDQTVKRTIAPALPPVPTHASVFCCRHPVDKVGRKQLERDWENRIYDAFIVRRVTIHDFRGGLIAKLNARSLAGEFIRTA